jgi:hypothetical protein
MRVAAALPRWSRALLPLVWVAWGQDGYFQFASVQVVVAAAGDPGCGARFGPLFAAGEKPQVRSVRLRSWPAGRCW